MPFKFQFPLPKKPGAKTEKRSDPFTPRTIYAGGDQQWSVPDRDHFYS